MAAKKTSKKVGKKNVSRKKASRKRVSKKKASTKKVSRKKVAKVSNAASSASSAIAEVHDHLEAVVGTGRRTQIAVNTKNDRGEFRGDFTRDTFDLNNRFSRVLMQQGRVQVDADWNEATSINLHYLRNLACDIGSEHWGPHDNSGFEISLIEDAGSPQVLISAGNYYVNGLLSEAGLDNNGDQYSYSNQPDYPIPNGHSLSEIKAAIDEGDEESALVYLDVWERHYTYINDDSIREVALGGPDTATRAKVIWQVKIMPIPLEDGVPEDDEFSKFKSNYGEFLNLIEPRIKPGKGRLCAKVKDKAGDDNDPCLVAPESRFRGAENQLYRVEIHKSGNADSSKEPIATYKWSRENASVIFPIISIQGSIVTLEHLGKDSRYGLKPNDWVELVDDDQVLQCRADNLFQVESIDDENRNVILTVTMDSTINIKVGKHAYLRRWDHVGGTGDGIPVVEASDGEIWLELENGIQVQFKDETDAVVADEEGNSDESLSAFKTGDYWLIPARTATGDIEWPNHSGVPMALLPHGVVHHYAPLAILKTVGDADDRIIDLRRTLNQAWS